MLKHIKWLFGLVSACAALVAGSYVIRFYNSSISKNPEQWGQLGDYIGGILNPIFGFTTILILVATIKIQGKQLKASRKELKLTRTELKQTAEAATKQANHFEKQAKLNEYLILIEKLAIRINRNYNENILELDRSLHFFVRNHQIQAQAQYVNEVKSFYSKKGSKTYAIIRWVESDLKRLSELIAKYEEISDLDSGLEKSPMPRFYKTEFEELVAVLYINALLPAEIKEAYTL